MTDQLHNEDPEFDAYIVLEGGLIQNEPDLPIYDLSPLEADPVTEDDINDAVMLYESIVENEHAAGMGYYLSRIERFVSTYGEEKHFADLRPLTDRVRQDKPQGYR